MSLFPSFSAACTSSLNTYAHSLDVIANIASILMMEAKKKKCRAKGQGLEISFVVLISIPLTGKARCLHITDGDPGCLHSNPPLSRGSQLYMNSPY